jgi:hypothetical protein
VAAAAGAVFAALGGGAGGAAMPMRAPHTVQKR